MRSSILALSLLAACDLNKEATPPGSEETSTVPAEPDPTTTDPTSTDTTPTDTTPTVDPTVDPGGDADADGVIAGDDCDDANPSAYPGAPETAGDGIDQDCDGVDDCFVDADFDSVGSDVVVAGLALICSDGFATVGGDCDDSQPDVWPGNRDWCDGLDNDCLAPADPLCFQFAAADSVLDTPQVGFGYYPQDLVAGDFDHDGIDDLAIGAVLADAVYVASGPAPLGSTPFDGAATRTLATGDFTQFFGFSLDGEDLDGDGFPELLVSAPFVQHAPGMTNGSVFVFDDLGALADPATEAAATVEIQGADTESGLAIWQTVAVGDFDADGDTDVVVGVLDDYNANSRLYVLPGPLSGVVSVFESFATVEEFGALGDYGVAYGAGDFDGDGLDDLIVPSPDDDEAYVFLGPFSGALTPAMADATLVAPAGSHLGSVLAVGDFDADGSSDVAMGGDGAQAGNGAIWVVHAPSVGVIDLTLSAEFVLTADGVWPNLADHETRIAARDVDGDGRDDLIAGASGQDLVGVVFGTHLDGSFGDFPISRADARIDGALDSRTGFNVAVGDLDGDGENDLAVGAYLAGEVGIWYGPLQ